MRELRIPRVLRAERVAGLAQKVGGTIPLRPSGVLKRTPQPGTQEVAKAHVLPESYNTCTSGNRDGLSNLPRW